MLDDKFERFWTSTGELEEGRWTARRSKVALEGGRMEQLQDSPRKTRQIWSEKGGAKEASTHGERSVMNSSP